MTLGIVPGPRPTTRSASPCATVAGAEILLALGAAQV